MSDEDERSSVEGITRKKKVRAGHRSLVTRIIGQLQNALNSASTRKLKQLKWSLNEKINILAKLDEELIDVAEEEHLEVDTEQADIVREDISLAIITIEEELEALTASSDEYSRQCCAEISTSPLSESREVGHLATSSSSMSARDSHTNYRTPGYATFPSTLDTSPLSGVTTTALFVPFHFSSSLVPIRGPLRTSGALPLTKPSSQPIVAFTSAGGLSGVSFGTTLFSGGPVSLTSSASSASDVPSVLPSMLSLPSGVYPSPPNMYTPHGIPHPQAATTSKVKVPK